MPTPADTQSLYLQTASQCQSSREQLQTQGFLPATWADPSWEAPSLHPSGERHGKYESFPLPSHLSPHICIHIRTHILRKVCFLIKRSQAKTFLSGIRNHRENESSSCIYLLSISLIDNGHSFLSCQSVYVQFVRVSTSMSFLFRFLK